MKVNEKKKCFLNEEVSVKLEGGDKKHPSENTTEDKEQDKREEMDTERDVHEEDTTKHSEA